MPVCDKCGKKLMVGARMCIYCGAEVENPVCPVPPKKQNQSQILIILLCCAVALGLLLAVLLLAGMLVGKNEPALQDITLPERVTIALPTRPTDAPNPTDPTDPPAPTDPVVKIPCTKINVDATLTLGKALPTMQLSYFTEPVDTTDMVSFTSNNPAVATVDGKGRVTAVGTGEAIIFITCGSITESCTVTCYMDEEIPDDPDDPEEPMPNLKLRMTDISFSKKGYQWRSFERTEGFDETKFTWKVDDETVATVDNGYITSVALGRTTMRVYYKGEQVASCIIRCNWTEEAVVPDVPEPPAPPVEAKYEIKINNVKPAYQYNNQENSGEITQTVGHKFKLTLVDKELAQIMNDVEWTLSDDTVCQLDGNYVVGLKKGTCKITCEYDGVTYLVFVRVTN